MFKIAFFTISAYFVFCYVLAKILPNKNFIDQIGGYKINKKIVYFKGYYIDDNYFYFSNCKIEHHQNLTFVKTLINLRKP